MTVAYGFNTSWTAERLWSREYGTMDKEGEI